MSTFCRRLCCLVILSHLHFLAHARADDKTDEQLFQKVMHRLLSTELVAQEYPQKYAWPPKYFIKADSAEEVNAYATAHEQGGAVFDKVLGKVRPVVMVTRGFLRKVVKGDENGLAAVMGHELGHLTKDHVGTRKIDTAFLFLAFSREHEIEADLDGMRYAVAAGFPYKAAITATIREMKATTQFTSFEGLHATHPSWEERLIFLDRQQPKLWSAMSAFQNGHLFLELEQYLPAEQCFRAVVKEFPDCYEGWANLGYSLLMQYCDGLEADDLRRFDIGQTVGGGFYVRPASLETKVRGIDEKAWHGAVKALKKALSLKDDLVLPRASLGVAHLVHPEGRDAKEAARWFDEAMARVKNDPGVKENPLSLLSLMINSGVADLANGNTKEAAQKFSLADKLFPKGAHPLLVSFDTALLYNEAMLHAQSGDAEQKKAACKKLEFYLEDTSPDSAWWEVAYQRYERLAKAIGQPALPKKQLMERALPQTARLVTSITVNQQPIFLSEPLEQALEHLGKDKGMSHPLYPDAKIVRWRFAEHGIDLIGKEKILAIFLTNPKAPAVKLQARGAAAKVRELRVGMAEKDAQDTLKDYRAEKSALYLANRDTGYRFYPQLGLALRVSNGRIEELVLAQVPRMGFED